MFGVNVLHISYREAPQNVHWLFLLFFVSSYNPLPHVPNLRLPVPVRHSAKADEHVMLICSQTH